MMQPEDVPDEWFWRLIDHFSLAATEHMTASVVREAIAAIAPLIRNSALDEAAERLSDRCTINIPPNRIINQHWVNGYKDAAAAILALKVPA